MSGRAWFQSKGSSGTRVEFRAGGEKRDVPVPGPLERAAAALVRWLEDLEERCAARRWERGRVVREGAPPAGDYRYRVTAIDGSGGETPVYRRDGAQISVAGRELEPAPACPTCGRRMRLAPELRVGSQTGWRCCRKLVWPAAAADEEASDGLPRAAFPVRRRLVDDQLQCCHCSGYIRLADRSCPLCRRVFDPNVGIEIIEEVRP